jgi:hypothetical protein
MATQLEMTDCYHKAEPGEPKFTLLARDPLAPNLTRLWAAIREGEPAEAANQFAELMRVGTRYVGEPSRPEKVEGACEIAGNMETWAAKHR